MPITEKQQKELNCAILEYLRDHGYSKTLESFLDESKQELPEKRLKILERKWTAVIRLTTKLQQVEKQLIETEDELKQAKPFHFDSFKGPKKLFDELLPNTQRHHLKGHQKAINKVVFHPNYAWLVTCADDSKIGVWDYESGKLQKFLRGHTNSVCDACFNPNGIYLASASVDMSVKIWNFEDEFRCEKTLNGHDHAVTGVRFCVHNDNLLVSCSRDGSVKVWELESGYCIKTLSDVHDGEWVKRVVISYDGSLMATCSVDKTLRVFDVKKDFAELQILRGHQHVVEDVQFSNPNTDDIIVAEALQHNRGAIGVSGDEDDDDSDSDGSEDDDENKAVHHTNNSYQNGVSLQQQQQQKAPRFIASASRDKCIMLWDIKSGECIMKLMGHENWVRSLVFHPCGRFLISCADDKSIRCWDLSKRRLFSKIDAAHNSFVSSIDWHPTESLLASVSVSKDVKIWCYDKNQNMMR